MDSYDGLNVYADHIDADAKMGSDMISKKEMEKIIAQQNRLLNQAMIASKASVPDVLSRGLVIALLLTNSE